MEQNLVHNLLVFYRMYLQLAERRVSFYTGHGVVIVCRSSCYRKKSDPEKESESNDISIHFVEFSNVYYNDGSNNATRSSL